jgi:hypothetical protein
MATKDDSTSEEEVKTTKGQPTKGIENQIDSK